MSDDSLIPRIVVKDNSSITKVPDGVAGNVAVLGYFGDITKLGNGLRTYTNYRDLVSDFSTALGSEVPTEDYNSLEYLFKQTDSSLGVTSVTVAPLTSDVRGTGFALTDLTRALTLLEGENFDILCIPSALPMKTEGDDTDIYVSTLITWLATRFANQSGVGIVFSLDSADGTVSTRLDKMDRGVYGVNTQIFNGLTLQKSTAYYCGQLAGRKVDKSTTYKVIEGITSLNTEFTFETDSNGYNLVKSGCTVFKCFDRRNKKYGVIRALTPAGYDVSEERTADYMTRAFQLTEFLGDSSNSITIDSVNGEVNSLIHSFVDELSLCEDIKTSISKVSASKVEIDLEYIFNGIITEIVLYIDITEE